MKKMSSTSRTSRRGGAATKETTPVVTPPSVPSSSSRVRSPSPLSPTRISRVEEKKQMRNLNDRLACYIEKVRQQNLEIGSLTSQITSLEETKTSEVTSVKLRYDKELAHVRKALDETSKDHAKLQIDAEKLERENRDFRTEGIAKDKLIASLERDLKGISARNNVLITDYEAMEREVGLLRPENAKLKKKLDDAKRNLEAETLQRIDAQNKLLSSEEGLKFDNDMLQTQLNESKRTKYLEISELDGRYSDEYEAKLQIHLAELRATYEQQIRENREEFGLIYDAKLEKLQKQLGEEKANSAGSLSEMRELATKIAGFTSRNAELEASNSALNQRLADLLMEMEDAAATYRSDIARKDAEIRAKEEQMEDMLNDYKNLMETKVALDMEIAAYSKMIEGEEARLGISQTDSPASVAISPLSRGIKRKRMMEEEEEVTYELVSELSGKGNVIIEPLEEDTTYIRLLNKSDEEVSIGGWKLINVAGETEATYKFHRSTTLPPGTTCTVHSSDVVDVDHSPPHDLVMKNGKWKTSDFTVTTLVNKDGEDESVRETRREKRIVGIRRHGYGQLYHREDDKNCTIM